MSDAIFVMSSKPAVDAPLEERAVTRGGARPPGPAEARRTCHREGRGSGPWPDAPSRSSTPGSSARWTMAVPSGRRLMPSTFPILTPAIAHGGLVVESRDVLEVRVDRARARFLAEVDVLDLEDEDAERDEHGDEEGADFRGGRHAASIIRGVPPRARPQAGAPVRASGGDSSLSPFTNAATRGSFETSRTPSAQGRWRSCPSRGGPRGPRSRTRP